MKLTTCYQPSNSSLIQTSSPVPKLKSSITHGLEALAKLGGELKGSLFAYGTRKTKAGEYQQALKADNEYRKKKQADAAHREEKAKAREKLEKQERAREQKQKSRAVKYQKEIQSRMRSPGGTKQKPGKRKVCAF